MGGIRGVKRSSPWLAALAAFVVMIGAGCGKGALELRSPADVGTATDDTVVLDCVGYPQVAPVQLILGCRRQGPWVESLKWQRWGQPMTSAVGYLRLGGWGRSRARVQLSGLALRRDATVSYRDATITARRVVPGWGTRRARYALQDGVLRRLDP